MPLLCLKGGSQSGSLTGHAHKRSPDKAAISDSQDADLLCLYLMWGFICQTKCQKAVLQRKSNCLCQFASTAVVAAAASTTTHHHSYPSTPPSFCIPHTACPGAAVLIGTEPRASSGMDLARVRAAHAWECLTGRQI